MQFRDIPVKQRKKVPTKRKGKICGFTGLGKYFGKQGICILDKFVCFTVIAICHRGIRIL